MDAVRAANLGYFWCHGAARRTPGKTAIVDLWNGAERRITYGALDARLDRVAAALARLGLHPGDRLLVCVGNRVEFLEIFFGAMRAGVVPVPANPRLGADALVHIATDSDCAAAIVDPAANGEIAGVVARVGIPRRVTLGMAGAGWDGYEAMLAEAPDTFVPPLLAPDHLAFMPYTSGSTGRPKGVRLTHAGQIWWLGCRHRCWPVTPDAVSLVAVPLFHKNAMGAAIKPVLHGGGAIIVMPRFEARAFLENLSRYRCTHTTGVPAVFILMLQEKDLLARLDFTALRSIMIGSAPVHEELFRAIERAFHCAVIQGYGLTEGGPVMFGPPLDGRASPVGSVGVPWPEGEVKLVDESGRAAAEQGELWVRNPGVAPGYHRLPEADRDKYRDGWLRTGDLFARDAAGFYYFRGRVDDMFVCGGENIYPKEVENLLMSHPGVAEACVVPLAHDVKGEVPAAMVVPARGAVLTETALKAFCLTRGPAYAHPRRILVVDALPLGGVGKVDREAVRAAFPRMAPGA